MYPSLVRNIEIVQEGIIGGDRTLIHKCSRKAPVENKYTLVDNTYGLRENQSLVSERIQGKLYSYPSAQLVVFWKRPCQC